MIDDVKLVSDFVNATIVESQLPLKISFGKAWRPGVELTKLNVRYTGPAAARMSVATILIDGFNIEVQPFPPYIYCNYDFIGLKAVTINIHDPNSNQLLILELKKALNFKLEENPRLGIKKTW